MKKLLIVLLAGVFCLGVAGVARATTPTDTATATVTVAEIAVLNVDGTLPTLAIVAPAAGGALPDNVTNAATRLQFTSNGTSTTTSRKVTAAVPSSLRGKFRI